MAEPESTRALSLRRRVLLLVLAATTVMWVVAALVTWLDAREEIDEILDAHLAQMASILAVQAAAGGAVSNAVDTEHAPLLHRYGRRVAFQVWEAGRTLRLHSANAPDRMLATRLVGFSDATLDGRRWRVFSAWDPGRRVVVQVGELASARNEVAGEAARNLLAPLAFALPVLALLVWFAISRGLDPLAALTRQLRDRAPGNLAPLAAGSAPIEVKPLVTQLNALFDRIATTLENERRFTADAAHELRTPVAGVKAQAQVALAATSDAGREAALGRVISGCDRISQLVDQLLTLARLDATAALAMQPCSLRAIASAVLATQGQAMVAAGATVELGDGDGAVAGVPALLEVLLRNLVDNAIRHGGRGTHVGVDVETDAVHATIVVRDDGPGISELDRAKVTERFFRPPGTTADGAGLGLSIVHRIAVLHGATLRLRAADGGRGLRVDVSFPRIAEPSPAAVL